VVKDGDAHDTTVLRGPATELLLHAFGRTAVALVEVSTPGSPRPPRRS
jgi:hypothetical protein